MRLPSAIRNLRTCKKSPPKRLVTRWTIPDRGRGVLDCADQPGIVGPVSIPRRPRSNMLVAATAMALATAVAGCDRREAPEPRSRMDTPLTTRLRIWTFLQTKAETLFAAEFPGVQVTELHISADLTAACGFIEAPGRAPALFSSLDPTPDTLDRSFNAPFLSADTPSHRRIEARRSAVDAAICRRRGILPDSYADDGPVGASQP